jgi:RsiW-degrading membrane proteinase PrsW (M82 family)
MWTVLVAAAPSLALLTYFYLRDRYEPEPISRLLLAFGLGMFAMLAAQSLGTYLADVCSDEFLRHGGEAGRLLDAFVVTALVEEFSRWFVLGVAVYHWKVFDEPMDGIVYGVAVAVGFASLENYLYLSNRGLSLAWQRALFAVPAHALFGGGMGYFLGRAKFGKATSLGAVLPWVWALLLPTLAHGAYDYALTHGLGFVVWIAVSVLSVGFWILVLGRLRHAEKASPFRPKTMLPSDFQLPPRK